MIPDDLKAERAALERAIAERQRQIDAAETQQWCEARARRTPDAETVVTKSAPSTRRDQAMSQDMSAEWQRHIAGEVRAAERRAIEAVASAVGEVLIEERKRFEEKLELEITKLRAEFLQVQLDEARGVKRHRNNEPGHLKAVPDKEALIA